MKPTDDEHRDPRLDAALSGLARTMQPSNDYTDRVLNELRERGFVRGASSRPRRVLLAATWFFAGVGAGVAALSMIRPDPAATPNTLAVSQASLVPSPKGPEEWY
jgi:hypothetical protein